MGADTSQRFITEQNPIGELTINDLELVVYVVHQHIFETLGEHQHQCIKHSSLKMCQEGQHQLVYLHRRTLR